VPRLALLGPSWPFRGGIARTTTALAAALQSREALAALLVPRRQYPRWIYPGGGDVDPAVCPHLPFAEALYGVLEPWTWPGTVRRLRSVSADALVVPYWTWAWAPLDRYVATRARVPMISVVHNPVDHETSGPARLGARTVLSRSRAFLCHAETVAAQLRRTYGEWPTTVHPLPAEPLRAVPREEARKALGVSVDRVAFLFFGLIRPYKGVEVLLDAFAALPDGGRALLLLAGEPWGDEKGRIARRLADPHLADRVIARLEWIPERDAAVWFAAADVAVLPYREATGSAVAAQAAGAGLPIVASSVGGLAQVVDDGVTGVLVPPGDASALAAALKGLLEDEARRRLAAATATAARRWTWRSYAGALLDLAVTVAEARAGAVPGRQSQVG
jgi:glycosyltransferase involved in cell wall biosynthesis